MATNITPIIESLITGILDNPTNDMKGVIDALYVGYIHNKDTVALSGLIKAGFLPTDRDFISMVASLPESQERSQLLSLLVNNGITG